MDWLKKNGLAIATGVAIVAISAAVAPRIKAAAELAARNKATGTIRVPEDFPTIKAALEKQKKIH
jgi:hypothetical protein